MSVYTELCRTDLSGFLKQFDLGQLVDFQGVAEGIENTNYRLLLEKNGQQSWYFLTLVEYGPDHPLSDFVALCSHFATYDAPVPAPFADREGHQLHELKGKPAILVPCVEGRHLSRGELTEQQLENLGQVIGHMHLAAMSFPSDIHNSKGLVWWQRAAGQYLSSLPKDQQDLLTSEIEYQANCYETYEHLPDAVVHGDLFLDNVLFKEDRISGVIDFFNAATDYLMFDLAIVTNDWCIDSKQELVDAKVEALWRGYEKERSISDQEKSAWPDFLRAAALRFWLSRLDTRAYQQGVQQSEQQNATEIAGKNPDEMANMLVLRRRACSLLKNAFEATSARQKLAKKRSL